MSQSPPGSRMGRRLLAAALLAGAVLQVTHVNPAVSQTETLVAWAADSAPGLDPASELWKRTAALDVPLTAQQVTYPHGGHLPMVQARALHHDGTLYVRVEWEDPTADDRTVNPGANAEADAFSDAVAVEFPATAASTVPSVCMGQADSGVNIWHWRADSQRGRPDGIEDLSSTGYVDGYPNTSDLFYTARQAGNPYAVVTDNPVQNLVARGFGTLGPAAQQAVTGRGVRRGHRWSVVFARPFAAPANGQPDFTMGTTSDIAFAVWDGAARERNGRKSVSAFVKLSISTAGQPQPTKTSKGVLAAGSGALIGLGLVFGRRVWKTRG